ncbi:carotenoid oxygenase family protein [Phormidium sp. LEGE 05292]|uniref:carotenoid oxygenase family protein n=1 Tax=[Phormidium] sp. LEGE 05292 TaxID=767427 RepID=UPI001882017E|nr:carotenoid oxygenase family protein [Phormidium sp. LEGE 05292]MBE9225724.1 carotenoid oxygenase family protein [Phormidium sp. LEGE 05292]
MQNFQLYEHASTVPVKSYDRQKWQKGYQSLKREFNYLIDDIEGEIPPNLQGTLFRNGPGLLDVNDQKLHHPFDGDGMICSFTFNNGKAYFQNRFVRTKGFVEEQKAGKILYRGVFGTQKPGGWLANAFDLKIKNIANTNVIYWGKKLLALWEAAEPYSLNPNNLATLEMEYFDRVLQEGDAFAAHPRIDPSCEWDDGKPRLVNFSIKPGLSTTITIYELNESGKIVQHHAHSVPGFAFIHDFAITPNYCIFFQNPVTFNPLPYVFGWQGAGQSVKFNPQEATRIIIIPRHSNTAIPGVKILETQSGFVFHHANAFEQDKEIYIDSVCYESLPTVEPNSDYQETDFDALSPGQLWRFVVNLNEQTVRREMLESRCCEFPWVHPAKVGRFHRYLYLGAAHTASGNAPLQAILKIDQVSGERQLWSAAPEGFVSEPVFVPAPDAVNEDDGWIMTLVYDSSRHRSDLVILDARNLHQEPITRLHLKHHVPYGLHGSFTPEVFEIQELRN